MKYTFGFIGCGNMGGALVRAAARSVAPSSIVVCDHNEEKTAALARDTGVTVADIRTVAEESEWIVLGVKPQAMEKTLAEIGGVLRERKDVTLVSMAAALSIGAIGRMAGGDLPMIRMMPNTPCLLGSGMILFTARGVSEEKKNAFVAAFSAAGRLDEVTEAEIDSAGALTGCGPAFAYLFAQALANGATECGADKERSVFYAAQTLKGAAEMLLTYGDPQTLANNVCSKGGTTIEGVKALQRGGFDETVSAAVKAAYARTLELKK